MEFWNSQVAVKLRKEWQLERWSEAVRWYLRWLECCRNEGMEVRSVGERMGNAARVGNAYGYEPRTWVTD